MEIINMLALSQEQKKECAQILTESLPQGWADLDAAMEEVRELDIPVNSLLALVEDGHVIAWGGLMPDYGGKVLELHPLVVRADRRGQGMGRMLLSALENVARARYAKVITLGCDDQTHTTSLADADLFENLPEKITAFESNGHPTGFYLKMGMHHARTVDVAIGDGYYMNDYIMALTVANRD